MRARTAAVLATGVLALTACSGSSDSPPAASPSRELSASPAGSGSATATTVAVSGNTCPRVFDASEADFYPIQPSFSVGYTVAAQKLDSSTEDWAYVIEGDFPYSQWMAWYLYDTLGVPLFKFSDSTILPDSGSTNPYVVGNKLLATPRKYHLYLMPHSTPASVVKSMTADGMNVVVMPSGKSTPGVSIVSRSYWSFSNYGLGDYDRFGYGGPTKTPAPTISAFLTDSSTGELTDKPVSDCGSASQLPKRVWYDPATNSPIITFKNAPVPTKRQVQDIAHFLLQTGSVVGSMGKEFPPAPVADQVQFYRNVAGTTPYADVQSAPPSGNPPDECGGYVMANLPNDVVSLVDIPKIPTFPVYSDADESTVNRSTDFEVQFYSIVSYGATKQVDAAGSPNNSQIGNTQIEVADDGSVTVVLWPQSATPAQVDQIVAVAKANHWNVLRSGVQTAFAPNNLVIREKGQNAEWKHALSANDVTQGAPCPQSKNKSLPLAQDPPSAAVTQFNGMGLSAPQGQNCSIQEFLAGACLAAFGQQLAKTGAQWSASSATPPKQLPAKG